jgi:hypothetical protein
MAVDLRKFVIPIFISKGTVHAFRVTSQTARLLNLYTHSCFERSVTIAGPSTLFRRSASSAICRNACGSWRWRSIPANMIS